MIVSKMTNSLLCTISNVTTAIVKYCILLYCSCGTTVVSRRLISDTHLKMSAHFSVISLAFQCEFHQHVVAELCLILQTCRFNMQVLV